MFGFDRRLCAPPSASLRSGKGAAETVGCLRDQLIIPATTKIYQNYDESQANI
jgi:hypothetical protein